MRFLTYLVCLLALASCSSSKDGGGGGGGGGTTTQGGGGTTTQGESWAKYVGNNTMPLTDGFGAGSSNKVVESVDVFNGNFYVALGQNGNQGGNPVSVWRSSDLLNWTQVSPSLASNPTDSLCTITHGSSAIFFGTANGSTPGQIYKSATGDTGSWSLFNGAGSGWTDNSTDVNGLANDGTYLYAGDGLNGGNGGRIWKRPMDGSSNWVLKYTLPTGITSTYIYAATINGTATIFVPTSAWPISNPKQAWLYESTDGGTTWQTNPGVGNGFGGTYNLNLAWLVTFGNYLYAGVHNPHDGAQLWRVSLSNVDGTWEEVSQAHNGFGRGTDNEEMHRAVVAGGYLWITTLSTTSVGTQVWKSSDGVTFTQSNSDGFDSGNKTGWFDEIIGFGDKIVWGGGAATGAQVWAATIK